jgi:ribosomal protein S18 acetylase RimI-like enzyme
MEAGLDRLAQLDDPAWNALRTGHAALAERDAAAMRYPAAMSPIAGLEVYTVEAFADLERLVPAGDAVGLVTRTAYELPADWEQLQTIPVAQMVCEAPPAAPEIVPVRLTEADVPEMLELVNATEPGPFRAGTIGMGRYFALKTPEGRLMAMAGERMRLDDFVEVSAVATWPEFRGRGLAKTLVSYVAALIAADGKTPFLHVKVDNAGAFALYEKLGFRQRAKLEFRVVRPRR